MQSRPHGLSSRIEAMLEKLPAEKQSPLRELLEALLEPAQTLQTHRDSLKRLEDKYLLALQEDSAKVVNFKVPEKNGGQKPSMPLVGDRRWLLKVPCLIESTSYGELFRMAFELHMRSARTIFLSWRDLDPRGRMNPLSLLELPSATIFVPDVTNLHLAEQSSILSVIRHLGEDKPHFMAGTYVPYSELSNLASLNREFLEAISQAYLKLTKSVSQYKREGLIRYFLESLS
jgi:hypothetical protein